MLIKTLTELPYHPFVSPEPYGAAWQNSGQAPTQHEVYSKISSLALGDLGGTLPASAISSGVFAPARLGTGSGGATKFLREDSTWQPVPTGITIGSTAISGGTNNRILYQSGGVVQQSGNLTFDGNSTAVATSSASAIPLTIQGAASQTANYFQVKKSNGNTLISMSEDSVGGKLSVHANNGVEIGFYRINPGGGTSGLELAGYNALNFINAASLTNQLDLRTYGSNSASPVHANWQVYSSRTFNFSGYNGFGGEVVMRDQFSGVEFLHAYIDSTYGGGGTPGVRFPSGKIAVGFGTAPAAKLHVIDTAEQLRLGYDASNYLAITVASDGAVTFNSIGSAPKFVFSDNCELGDGKNILVGSGTGSIIGQSASKLAFFDGVPAGRQNITGTTVQEQIDSIVDTLTTFNLANDLR